MRREADPEHLLRTLAEAGATFTSLVPTHYIMMLGLPAAVRSRYDVGAVRKLMISSAPARRDTKLAIMDHFRSSGLFELYGSTEAGWVTMLHPGEQLSKLGSVGHECVGSRRIRLLDADGNDVPEGQTGELYSSNGYTFDGYWGMPEKTREAFRGRNCTVGDLISGGENVYPSEVDGRVVGTTLRHSDYAALARSLGAHGERVERAQDLQGALRRALANAPALVDVVTSQSVISSDAQKGLGFVPDFQALTAWDNAERRRRGM
jgi:acyl-CoA synthetase (AMP-forming)/AMP-acid ligase II